MEKEKTISKMSVLNVFTGASYYSCWELSRDFGGQSDEETSLRLRRGQLTVEDVDVVITDEDGSGFGKALAIGDVTGDGINDLVVGAPDKDSRDAILIFFGSEDWEGSINTADGTNVVTLDGESNGEIFGADLLLTDTDGDGIDEIYTLRDRSTPMEIIFDPSGASEEGAGANMDGVGYQLNPRQQHGILSLSLAFMLFIAFQAGLKKYSLRRIRKS